ncbi:MAG: hypothetical protein U1F36_18980 [Planctomycetota bacterium]
MNPSNRHRRAGEACAVLGLLVLAPSLCSQSIGEIRDELRRSVRAARYPLFMATLTDFAEDGLLAGGHLHIDGSPGTALSLLSLPFTQDLDLFGSPTKLRVEGTAGMAQVRVDIPDLWSGALPGLETRAVSRYRAFAADLGAGPSFEIVSHVRAEALVHGGLSYIDNDTDYEGPGSALARALVDGFLFNWSASYGSFGTSIGLRQIDGTLGEVRFRSLLRYDWRCTGSLKASDPSLQSDDSVQWLTARLDFEGPTGWTLGAPLDWLSHLGYRRIIGDARHVIGYDDYLEIGAGLRANTNDSLPLLSGIELSGSFIYGTDIIGWTAGLSVSF